MVYTVSMQHSIKEVTAKDSSTSFPSMENFSGVALFFGNHIAKTNTILSLLAAILGQLE